MIKILSLFFSGTTVEARLQETRFRPSGFDYMRVILALGVIASHSTLLAYGKDHYHTWKILHAFEDSLVPLFFSLSGFLVAGSFVRSKTLISFFGLRVLRIGPALSLEVFLSALILGPIFTELPLKDYFSSSVFHQYFWNLVGDVHYHLPGVFENTPVPGVNGQLWTVPCELMCYIMLAVIAILGAFKSKTGMMVLIAAYYLAEIVNTIMRPNIYDGATATSVVGAFLGGLFVYRYRTTITWTFLGFFSSIVALFGLIYLIKDGMRFSALPIAYIAAYLGLLNPRRNKIIASGDYSYGMYLYAYPIQQAVVEELPHLREWYFNLLISIPLIFTFAAFSWWFIEKPSLRFRTSLQKLEETYIKLRRRVTKKVSTEI